MRHSLGSTVQYAHLVQELQALRLPLLAVLKPQVQSDRKTVAFLPLGSRFQLAQQIGSFANGHHPILTPCNRIVLVLHLERCALIYQQPCSEACGGPYVLQDIFLDRLIVSGVQIAHVNAVLAYDGVP